MRRKIFLGIVIAAAAVLCACFFAGAKAPGISGAMSAGAAYSGGSLAAESRKTTIIKNFFDRLGGIKSDKAVKERKKEEVYIGGTPIGITLGAEGLIIAGKNDVITKSGVVSPAVGADISGGDILLSVNGFKTKRPEDIAAALKGNNGERVTLKLKRGGNEFEERIRPAEDSLTGLKRLGLIVKTDIMGIGTLTYIKADGRYGALGHQIADAETGLKDLSDGDIYGCTIIGVVKGERNKAGELRGLINKSAAPIGTIDKNNHFGIFGEAAEPLSETLEKVEVGGKYSVKPGKAEIRTTVLGDTPERYDIEIVKTNFQGEKSEKGMIIRVTDDRLLKNTGGILQGMSGSPIIQDGKLVGAVTHVFINDPTKGYGMYIDWMLGE
jgi:stage IV sporulation protein B